MIGHVRPSLRSCASRAAGAAVRPAAGATIFSMSFNITLFSIAPARNLFGLVFSCYVDPSHVTNRALAASAPALVLCQAHTAGALSCGLCDHGQDTAADTLAACHGDTGQTAGPKCSCLWQFGHSATAFSTVSSPPAASGIL